MGWNEKSCSLLMRRGPDLGRKRRQTVRGKFRMETNKRHSRLVPVCAMFAGASVLMSAMTISTKTVAVYDGAERKLVHTTANDPGIVARAAGLQLSADDDVFFTDDPAEGFGVLQINRAFPVLISADGKAHMLQTTGGTVSSILADAGITLSPEVLVYPAADEPLTQGSDITVRRVEVRNEQVAESIPYESTTVNNPDLPYGQSRVAVAGQAGEKVTTFRVEYRDGEEYSRTSLSTEITRQPVTEVIEIGTGGVVEYNGNVYPYSRVIQMSATAYTTEHRKGARTASGTVARVGAVAVDKNVIPLGTRLFIRGSDGSFTYGVAVAEDTGSAIKGNKIDLYFNTYRECIQFGRQDVTVYVLK